MCKCGFAGDDAPRAVFPVIVGRPRNPGIMVGMDFKDHFVGDEAQAKRGILNLTHPIERGRITNIVDYEKVLHHTFYNELQVGPSECLCSFADPKDIERRDREKILSILFETFGLLGMHSSASSSCAMYASGQTSGCVVHAGAGYISATAIYEGYGIGFERCDMGGADISELMVSLLSDRGFEMTTSAEREIVRDMKEKHGYVCVDCADAEMLEFEALGGNVVKYELPDGSKMEVADDLRFLPPEILFDPNHSTIAGHLSEIMKKRKERGKKIMTENEPTEGEGEEASVALRPIDEIAARVIQQSAADVRKNLIENVLLEGGSTMFPGFPERLKKELRARLDSDEHLLAQSNCSVSDLRVRAPAERKFSTWIGASILGSLSTFGGFWLTKDIYDDAGPSVIHRKCML